MKHIYWLRDGVIAGRTGPDRDGWSPTQLAKAGIGAILSVNDAALVHVEDLHEVGISHKCVPFSDAAPPLPGDFEVCLDALPRALEFAVHEIASGKSVLVHCSSGKDRTGMFLSYFLCVTEGLSPGEAIMELRRFRPIALSAEGWEEFTFQVLTTLAGRSNEGA